MCTHSRVSMHTELPAESHAFTRMCPATMRLTQVSSLSMSATPSSGVGSPPHDP